VLASIGITKMLEIPAIPEQDFPAMTGFGRVSQDAGPSLRR
jgi:hypothetical protein